MTTRPLLRSKLVPPRLNRWVAPRPALLARLREAGEHRLTLLQAGTGYGKTTMLAALAADSPSACWYTVERGDLDPQRFLAYLIESFRLRLPDLDDGPAAMLHERRHEESPERWTEVLDTLLNALDAVLADPALLLLDDLHTVTDAPDVAALVERLVRYAPQRLHLVAATRHPLALASLPRLRARGELLEFDRRALAFDEGEIAGLFREHYGLALAPDEVALLAERTEGWPIALQLVWQRLRDTPSARPRVGELLARGPDQRSLGALFDYLAHDVYALQPEEMRRFLSEVAVLRVLDAGACEAVSGDPASVERLARLHEQDLFVVALGDDQYRFHHLFHDFLRQHRHEPEALCEQHRRAARYFEARGEHETAIHHRLGAGDAAEAARAIERAGSGALREGRLDTVAGWIDALPPEILEEEPALQAMLGDLCRLRSRFDEALGWYAAAERLWRARATPAGVSRALRGQARVYLDTVRPARAESLLEEALRVTDGIEDRDARARLLELIAENKLNLGKPDEASRLRDEARRLRETGPVEDALSVRVRLRTGQLDAARRILEGWVESERREVERGEVHPPRAHRESALLLSLVCSLTGEPERARALAEEGIALGERLDSPFVTVVGHMRLGHALQLLPPEDGVPDPRARRDAAVACYRRAIELGDRLAVRRSRLEAMWGLTRAHGFAGDLDAARRSAAEGAEIGQRAGDTWVIALGDLALGASCLLAGEVAEAIERLEQVRVAFDECGDLFGLAASRMWLALCFLRSGQEGRLRATLDPFLELCEREGYDFLFRAPSLLGPPEPRALLPLLLHARELPRWRAFAERQLATLGMAGIESHPGYTLRVRTLGDFALWRGEEAVEPRAWKREAARQLFQLLVTRRGEWLQREAIAETLWPERQGDAAIRDFKVALTALNKVLEPARAADAPYAYIERDGSAYRLRPEADLWLDVEELDRAVARGIEAAERGDAAGAISHLDRAVTLYRGPYLPDALYTEWSEERRARALARFVRAAERLAALHCERGAHHEAIAISRRLLAHEPCWESAYRTMMRAHAALGERPLALRAYATCVATLREQLGVGPAAETVALYVTLGGGEDA